MPEFEYTPDPQAQPEEDSPENIETPETKIFVIAFKYSQTGDIDIITGPDARLLSGKRTSINPKIKYNKCPSLEHDAIEIADEYQISATAHSWLYLPDGPIPYTQGYSVERAHHSPLPNMADYTNHPTPAKHNLPLEIHRYSQLERLNSRPERATELAYLRAFGDLVINRSY